MKQFLILMTVYVLVQSGSDITKISYEGMDRTQIEELLDGKSYRFVDRNEFDNTVIQRVVDPVRVGQKQQARQDVRNTTLTQGQRLQALLILLDFDR